MAHRARIVVLLLLLAFAAANAQAQGRCRFLKVVEWPVRPGGTHIVVDGAINGKPVGIMLDTGAMVSSIERHSAVALGLPLRDAPGRQVVGIGGQAQAQIATVDEFKLGEAATSSLQLLVVGDDDRHRPWDVMLGEDFLQRFDVEFDLRRQAVRLFQPRDCDGVSLAYWAKENVAEVGIEAIVESRPRIEFEVRLNDRTVNAMLDSGAGVSIVPYADAEALGIRRQSPDVTSAGAVQGVGARAIPVWTAPFASFAIGNETIPDVRIAFAEIWKNTAVSATGSNVGRKLAREPMIVGADFLRAHRMLVSHSQRRLYFTYEGGPVFAGPPPPKVPTARDKP
ncbi:MAG: retroviral-like aspartic protease family protein [Burkholderiales bacterium]